MLFNPLGYTPKIESYKHRQVRITGKAEVVKDQQLLDEIWNANTLLKHYLGSIDNPELIVYRIVPTRVRFMLEWALKYYEIPMVSH
jgi:general stress protein 26